MKESLFKEIFFLLRKEFELFKIMLLSKLQIHLTESEKLFLNTIVPKEESSNSNHLDHTVENYSTSADVSKKVVDNLHSISGFIIQEIQLRVMASKKYSTNGRSFFNELKRLKSNSGEKVDVIHQKMCLVSQDNSQKKKEIERLKSLIKYMKSVVMRKDEIIKEMNNNHIREIIRMEQMVGTKNLREKGFNTFFKEIYQMYKGKYKTMGVDLKNMADEESENLKKKQNDEEELEKFNGKIANEINSLIKKAKICVGSNFDMIDKIKFTQEMKILNLEKNSKGCQKVMECSNQMIQTVTFEKKENIVKKLKKENEGDERNENAMLSPLKSKDHPVADILSVEFFEIPTEINEFFIYNYSFNEKGCQTKSAEKWNEENFLKDYNEAQKWKKKYRRIEKEKADLKKKYEVLLEKFTELNKEEDFDFLGISSRSSRSSKSISLRSSKTSSFFGKKKKRKRKKKKNGTSDSDGFSSESESEGEEENENSERKFLRNLNKKIFKLNGGNISVDLSEIFSDLDNNNNINSLIIDENIKNKITETLKKKTDAIEKIIERRMNENLKKVSKLRKIGREFKRKYENSIRMNEIRKQNNQNDGDERKWMGGKYGNEKKNDDNNNNSDSDDENNKRKIDLTDEEIERKIKKEKLYKEKLENFEKEKILLLEEKKFLKEQLLKSQKKLLLEKIERKNLQNINTLKSKEISEIKNKMSNMDNVVYGVSIKRRNSKQENMKLSKNGNIKKKKKQFGYKTVLVEKKKENLTILPSITMQKHVFSNNESNHNNIQSVKKDIKFIPPKEREIVTSHATVRTKLRLFRFKKPKKINQNLRHKSYYEERELIRITSAGTAGEVKFDL